MVTAPVRRSRKFDLLRILFATLVILSHAFAITDGNKGSEPLIRCTHTNLSFGVLAVDGFFLLSGYLIVQSWQRHPNLRDFLRNRFLRIVPGFVVAFLLSTLFVGLAAPGVDHFFHQLGRRYLVSLLLFDSPMTPLVFPGIAPNVSTVNGSLWTIPYELRCYLLVAVCGSLSILRRRGIWLAGAVVLLAASLLPPAPTHGPWYIYIPTGYPYIAFRLAFAFVTGGCFYLYRDRPVFKPLLAVLAVLGLVMVGWLLPKHLEPAVALFGGYLMFYFCSRPSRMINALPPFSDISYGLYLYAWPVESFLIWYLHRSPLFTFFVATAVCVVLSWLSWHLVEQPMLQFKSVQEPQPIRAC